MIPDDHDCKSLLSPWPPLLSTNPPIGGNHNITLESCSQATFVLPVKGLRKFGINPDDGMVNIRQPLFCAALSSIRSKYPQCMTLIGWRGFVPYKRHQRWWAQSLVAVILSSKLLTNDSRQLDNWTYLMPRLSRSVTYSAMVSDMRGIWRFSYSDPLWAISHSQRWWGECWAW